MLRGAQADASACGFAAFQGDSQNHATYLASSIQHLPSALRTHVEFLRWSFRRRRGGRRAGADDHSSAESPPLPRRRSGRRWIFCAKPCSAIAASCTCATCCCLALRTLCVLLFGLAMARPYFSRTDGPGRSRSAGARRAAGRQQPEHGLRQAGWNAVGRSPRQGGRVHPAAAAGEPRHGAALVRLGGGLQPGSVSHQGRRPAGLVADRDRRPQRQRRAGGRPGRSRPVAARRTCRPSAWCCWEISRRSTGPPARSPRSSRQLPEVQVVQIARPELENTWIADFKLQDGVADVESTGHVPGHGPLRRSRAAQRRAGHAHDRRHGRRQQDAHAGAGPDGGSELSVSLRCRARAGAGQLRLGRGLAAARSAAGGRSPLPDGRRSWPRCRWCSSINTATRKIRRKNQYGETFLLRRLLAPVTIRGDFGRQLIQVRHLRIDELDREALAGCPAGGDRRRRGSRRRRRACCGITCEQGGQLVICAGGEFDPAAWQAVGLAGRGRHSARSAGQPAGRPVAFGGQRAVAAVSVGLRQHVARLLPDRERRPLRRWKISTACRCSSRPCRREVDRASAGRSAQRGSGAARSAARRAGRSSTSAWDASAAWPTARRGARQPRHARRTTKQRRHELAPRLARSGGCRRWRINRSFRPKSWPAARCPACWPAITNKTPFMVQRQIGRGQVLFVSSGVFANALDAHARLEQPGHDRCRAAVRSHLPRHAAAHAAAAKSRYRRDHHAARRGQRPPRPLPAHAGRRRPGAAGGRCPGGRSLRRDGPQRHRRAACIASRPSSRSRPSWKAATSGIGK